MVDDGVLEVRVIEEGHAEGLQRLEQLAVRLTEVEGQIEDCKGKLSQVEGELEEFRQRCELERRFSELTGLQYRDKSLELEEEMKSLKSRLESLTSERAKLYEEILTGLSNVVFPIEKGASQSSENEVSFKFRDGGKYPAVTEFLKSELKFGIPPVYVAVFPEGVKVVGVSDETSALKEIIKAIEALRAKAASQRERYGRAESLSLKHSLEGFSLFRKILK
ncbi:MAG: hypothetical protein ACTSXC_05620 [Candidatus Freyarchaeota archaeon]